MRSLKWRIIVPPGNPIVITRKGEKEDACPALSKVQCPHPYSYWTMCAYLSTVPNDRMNGEIFLNKKILLT